MGSVTGKALKISVFGESHGKCIGAVIDGFPAGIELDDAFISREMQRRAPAYAASGTKRSEHDIPEITSGVLNGITTGAPICVIINNSDTRSRDYSEFARVPRPGHSDYTGLIRYNGFNDIRGGGHFSGRLTAPLVFAGALSKLVLKRFGIEIGAHILRVGTVTDTDFSETPPTQSLLTELVDKKVPVIRDEAGHDMLSLAESARESNDSVGGVVECAVIGAPVGLGSPIFDCVESRLAAMLFAIPAVRGVEFGMGFEASSRFGSDVNDSFTIRNGKVATSTNNHGGILGGITSGMPILFKTAFKPTASISKPQNSVDLTQMKDTEIKIAGRHDPCIVFRAVPVVEACASFTVLDLILEAKGYEYSR